MLFFDGRPDGHIDWPLCVCTPPNVRGGAGHAARRAHRTEVVVERAGPLLPVPIWRLMDEERFLLRNLHGHTDYQHRVRYHLLPWIW